jgi:hypothetical protein
MNKWILKDGFTVTDYTSFPYAFRTMYNAVRKAKEKGLNPLETIKKMSIVSPLKDAHGDYRIYSYADAVRMAENQGLLTPAGELNSREFKFKRR